MMTYLLRNVPSDLWKAVKVKAAMRAQLQADGVIPADVPGTDRVPPGQIVSQPGTQVVPSVPVTSPATTETLPATAPQLALRLGAGKDVRAVGSLEEAAQLWDRVRDQASEAGEGGSSNAPGATVVDTRTGDVVARISYNGRVWDPNNDKRELVERNDGRGYGKPAAIEVSVPTAPTVADTTDVAPPRFAPPTTVQHAAARRVIGMATVCRGGATRHVRPVAILPRATPGRKTPTA